MSYVAKQNKQEEPTFQPKQNIRNYYYNPNNSTRKQIIGRGTYGTCVKMIHKETQKSRAVKEISKRSLSSQDSWQNEIKIMAQLDHPNIIKYYECFEDDLKYYLVMDLCEGFQLSEVISLRGLFSEQESQYIFKNVVEAVSHCHSKKVCHKDLKPENIILEEFRDHFKVSLIDFGLSQIFEREEEEEFKDEEESDNDYDDDDDDDDQFYMNDIVGSLNFLAPEVLESRYTQKCDVWSLGILLYYLLTGVLPFESQDPVSMMNMIINRQIDFSRLEGKSQEAVTIIKDCLLNENKRPQVQDILKYDWLK